MSWDEVVRGPVRGMVGPMTADVAFYVGLARAADGPLVELAIGNGRVAIPVAQATGKPVIGIDSSPAMLAKARAGPRRRASASICAKATCATWPWTSPRG